MTTDPKANGLAPQEYGSDVIVDTLQYLGVPQSTDYLARIE